MNVDSAPALLPDPELLGHFRRFQSSFGLRRLRFYVWTRRLAWRWLVEGTDAAKRIVDVAVSATALAVLSPLLLVIAVCIVLDDEGPVLFLQTRVGQYGRPFRMLKFRSMRRDAEKYLAQVLAANQHAAGVTFKLKRDPRVTRVGRWLRRFSLDELPQLYNVLVGDMSLVGPRPPVPREVEKYSLTDRRRLMVKPGLTCLWQISGRAEIDFPGQVKLDVAYIENQCLTEDLRILLRTVPAVLLGAGAY